MKEMTQDMAARKFVERYNGRLAVLNFDGWVDLRDRKGMSLVGMLILELVREYEREGYKWPGTHEFIKGVFALVAMDRAMQIDAKSWKALLCAD